VPEFIIERNMPGVGGLDGAKLQSASQTSCSTLRKLGPNIQWVQSYVTPDKIFCVYRAPSEDLIRQHAQQSSCKRISHHTVRHRGFHAGVEPPARLPAEFPAR